MHQKLPRETGPFTLSLEFILCTLVVASPKKTVCDLFVPYQQLSPPHGPMTALPAGRVWSRDPEDCSRQEYTSDHPQQAVCRIHLLTSLCEKRFDGKLFVLERVQLYMYCPSSPLSSLPIVNSCYFFVVATSRAETGKACSMPTAGQTRTLALDSDNVASRPAGGDGRGGLDQRKSKPWRGGER